MVNQDNFAERLRDARSILRFAEDSYQCVLRIYDIVQSNEAFFYATPGADKLELATLKLETLVDQWRYEQSTASATSDSARLAAEETCAYFGDTELAMSDHVNANAVAAIISKHFAAAPADNDAESLLQHVAYSGVEFDDNRIGYVVVQIDRDVWEQIKKLAPTTTKGDR